MNSAFGNPAALQGCESPSMTKRACIINERLMTGWDVDMSARCWSSLKAVGKECTPLSEQFYARRGTITTNILFRFIIIILVTICILTSDFGQGVLHEHNSMTVFFSQAWSTTISLAQQYAAVMYNKTTESKYMTSYLFLAVIFFGMRECVTAKRKVSHRITENT